MRPGGLPGAPLGALCKSGCRNKNGTPKLQAVAGYCRTCARERLDASSLAKRMCSSCKLRAAQYEGFCKTCYAAQKPAEAAARRAKRKAAAGPKRIHGRHCLNGCTLEVDGVKKQKVAYKQGLCHTCLTAAGQASGSPCHAC